MEARAEAIEVIARVMWDFAASGLEPWQELDDEERGIASEGAALVLDALLSPQSVECETCGGTGDAGAATAAGKGPWTFGACPSCNGSGRIERGPMAYLAAELEHVGCQDLDGSLWPLAIEPFDESARVYRLPSESTNGVKDE